MFEKFTKLTIAQANVVYGGAQEVADIDRTQPY